MINLFQDESSGSKGLHKSAIFQNKLENDETSYHRAENGYLRLKMLTLELKL